MQETHDGSTEFAEVDEVAQAAEAITRQIEKMRADGLIYERDKIVLLYMLKNPTATHAEIASALNIPAGAIGHRLNSAKVRKARELIDGTIAEKMAGAVDNYARWASRTMEMANEPFAGVLADALAICQKRGNDPEMIEATINMLCKRLDPRILVTIGTQMMNYATEQAKIQAQQHQGTVETLPSIEEAKRILEADVITSAETPVIEIKPIG